jgi:hypothetical protein
MVYCAGRRASAMLAPVAASTARRKNMRVVLSAIGLLGLAASGAVFAQAPAAAPAAAASQHASVAFEEAEISINNRAGADGYVRIRVTPVGGQAKDTTVDVLGRMGENDIAADIEKALVILLRGLPYEVKRGGESVRIRKAERTSPNFAVEIAFNTPNLGIVLKN